MFTPRARGTHTLENIVLCYGHLIWDVPFSTILLNLTFLYPTKKHGKQAVGGYKAAGGL